MRAPCTVRASIPTSQHQDVTCNPGAASRSGQYLLLRHVHTPDWQTVGLQQKHAALPGFVFPCFLFIFPCLLFSYYFSSCFPKHICARSTSTFSQSSSLLSVSAGCSRSVFLSWREKYSYTPSMCTFSSDSCPVGHISFGVHWKDLHFAAGIIVKFSAAIL